MSLPHGGNIYYYAKKLGVPVDSILDFSASINPLGISPKAVSAVKKSVGSLVNYPDPDCSALADALALYHGIGPDSILAGNGSTELIYLLPRALNAKTALVLSPGFSDYERAAKLAGCRIRRVMLKEDAGFFPDIDRIIKALPGTDVMFLCNPNNPTGVMLDRDTVFAILDAARKAGTFVVIDEAFIDYRPEYSVMADAVKMSGVAVVRNFTKFHGMPGLRIGWLAAHPKVIRMLCAVKEPWSVNTLAQSAAVASLSDHRHATASIAFCETERKFLYEKLSAMPGVTAYPPSVNFVMARLDTGPGAAALAAELASNGILIRDCSNFRGLDSRYIRVAVRSRADNERLVAALKCSEYFTAR